MISGDRQRLLGELEARVGHVFASPVILDRALTHRSFANEHENEGYRHNENYELLGDSILSFLVCEWLLERFPDEDEGCLAKIKGYLVSEVTLEGIAREIDLGKYLRLNKGEEKTGGRDKRALLVDAFEALVAALYLDGGLDPARNLIRELLGDALSKVDPADLTATDYKSALQEALQAGGMRVPSYRIAYTAGPHHRKTFYIDVAVDGDILAQGEGQSIKRAEQDAARRALERFPVDDESEEEEDGGDA